jgi:protein SCO1/2
MRHSGRIALAITMLVALPLSASAHSLQELEQQLTAQETYFQAMEKPAPDFILQDADGRIHRMTDFRGKVLVLNFIYTHCPDTCPLHAEKIAEIQKLINGTPMRSQVEFITITTDPQRDTGAVLRDYGATHGLDPANWLFLTAAPDQAEDATRRLAQTYGLEFTPTPDGMEMHGVVTHVIDQDGILRARFHGLEFQPVNLVLFVNALTNHLQKPHQERQPTLWERLKTLF